MSDFEIGKTVHINDRLAYTPTSNRVAKLIINLPYPLKKNAYLIISNNVQDVLSFIKRDLIIEKYRLKHNDNDNNFLAVAADEFKEHKENCYKIIEECINDVIYFEKNNGTKLSIICNCCNKPILEASPIEDRWGVGYICNI